MTRSMADLLAAKEDIETLTSLLRPGMTLHTILRDRSPSGMSRSIDLYLLTCGDRGVEKRWLSRLVSHVLPVKFDEKRDAIRVRGAGQDMGYHLVWSLSAALFPDGFDCIGEHCPSSDHVNGDRDYSPHRHKSGGYALRHEWL